jgi:hypothetical protein
MVSGLFVATLLTLFLMPILFRAFMRLRGHRVRTALVHVVQRFNPSTSSNRNR